MKKPAAAAAAPPRRQTRGSTSNEKSLVHRIRSFQWSEPANRKCADCSERGPTYICLTFQTFVCQTCSGIHRSFGHKIKGISLSDWSIKELEALEAGGNTRAAAVWLARWNAAEFPEPDSTQTDAVKEFIKKKYEEKLWWQEPKSKPQSKPPDTCESNDEKANLRVPQSPAGLRPTEDEAKEAPAPATATQQAKPVVQACENLLDSDGPVLPTLTPPPGSNLVDIVSVPPAAAEAKSEWTADFGANAASIAAPPASEANATSPATPAATLPAVPTTTPTPAAAPVGLLDLDFDPQPTLPAPTAVSASPDCGAVSCNLLDAPALISEVAPAVGKEVLAPATAPASAGLCDGLAGVDFGSGPGTSGLCMKTCSAGGAADLFESAFGGGPMPTVNPAGADLCAVKTPAILQQAVESPLMEPAEEPAPTLAANGKDESSNLSDRLREAVMSNSSGDLKQLFRECLEPQKRPASDDRLAAFAAFDELSGTVPSYSKPEVVAHQSQSTSQQPWFGAASLGAPGHAASALNSLPPAFAAPVCGPTCATEPAMSSGHIPAPTPGGSMTTQQIGQLMPQSGMLAPHQLEQLNQQELMQMQIMISQAMQARAQQQRVTTGAAMQPPAVASAQRSPAPAPAAGGKCQGSVAQVPQASQRAPSPPKEFGDLLAAFHARNPIKGIELKA